LKTGSVLKTLKFDSNIQFETPYDIYSAKKEWVIRKEFYYDKRLHAKKGDSVRCDMLTSKVVGKNPELDLKMMKYKQKPNETIFS